MSPERCYATTGDVWTGPQYCGRKARGKDDNGRPCCGLHLGKYNASEWWGDRGRYPHGIGGKWTFRVGGAL